MYVAGATRFVLLGFFLALALEVKLEGQMEISRDQCQCRKENSTENQCKAYMVFKRRLEGWTREGATEHRRKKLGMMPDEAGKEGRGQITQTIGTLLKIFLPRKVTEAIAWFVCTASKFSVYQTHLGNSDGGAAFQRLCEQWCCYCRRVDPAPGLPQGDKLS